jgi:hypothetical protein
LPLGDSLQVHAIAADGANAAALAAARIAVPSFYVLRPDGHVGLSGARVDVTAIRRYVTERLRIGETEAR